VEPDGPDSVKEEMEEMEEYMEELADCVANSPSEFIARSC